MMTFVTRFFAAMVAVAILAAPAFAQARLKAQITVDDDIVRLGDLVTGAGGLADRALFRAPAPGTTGVVGAQDVALAAYRAGLDLLDLAGLETITVTRANTMITRDAIASLLTFAIAEKNGDPLSSIQLVSEDLPASARHSTGGLPASITGVTIDANRGRVTATLLTHSKRGARRTPLLARLDFVDDALVLADPLARGDILKRADLVTMSVSRKMARNSLNDISDLVGMQARRAMPAGSVIRQRDIKAPTLVVRNREVLINVKRGRLTITARGEAMENGALGDVIDVMNTRSQKVLQGTVQRDGTVLVGTRGFAAPTTIRKARARRSKMDILRQTIEGEPLRGSNAARLGDLS